MAWFKRQSKGIQTPTEKKKDIPKGLWYKSPTGKIVDTEELQDNFYVSPEDDYHVRIGSREYFSIIFDDKFKELDKKSNGYISRSIKDSISPSNQNHLISSLGGVKAKKILLINDLNEKDDIYLWLNKYKYIAKIANSNWL